MEVITPLPTPSADKPFMQRIRDNSTRVIFGTSLLAGMATATVTHMSETEEQKVKQVDLFAQFQEQANSHNDMVAKYKTGETNPFVELKMERWLPLAEAKKQMTEKNAAEVALDTLNNGMGAFALCLSVGLIGDMLYKACTDPLSVKRYVPKSEI